MSIIKRAFRAIERSHVNLGRTHAREYLLGRDDRFLADSGFSRELLEQGNGAWPWQAGNRVATTTPEPAAVPESIRRQAVTELTAMSQADLDDLDVARGEIDEVVRHGRPGIERQAA